MSHSVINVIDLGNFTAGAYGERHYRFSVGGLPNRGVRAVGAICSTKEEAKAAASAIVDAYIANDSFSNFGHFLGVIEKDGGFQGVINTYHSNS
jgi:hypothetical protein